MKENAKQAKPTKGAKPTKEAEPSKGSRATAIDSILDRAERRKAGSGDFLESGGGRLLHPVAAVASSSSSDGGQGDETVLWRRRSDEDVSSGRVAPSHDVAATRPDDAS
jgi:hypothetical protein